MIALFDIKDLQATVTAGSCSSAPQANSIKHPAHTANNNRLR